MIDSDILNRFLSADVPCQRCTKSMAVERLYYAVQEVTSIGYKCLSCGYEETRMPKTGGTIKED